MNDSLDLENYVEIELPASKSVLNRALLLAALREGDTKLICGGLCEDVCAMIGCLRALGISIEEKCGALLVRGCGGNFKKTATLDVQSAGTVARFLPPLLAVLGGDFFFTSSEQMKKRPMDGLRTLEAAGAKIEFSEEAGRFPFRLRSEGLSRTEWETDTETSTQFASGLLLAACAMKRPCTVRLSGSRKGSPYLGLTEELLQKFGFACKMEKNFVTVLPQSGRSAGKMAFSVEADVSAACYFGALALLCRKKVFLRGVRSQTPQGDFAFLRLLAARGLLLHETADGLYADGSGCVSFRGFEEDFGDFSDQALTAAVLAPFADSPSRLQNIGHIRFQESDRIGSIVQNLSALQVPVSCRGDTVEIHPAPVRSCTLATFRDHRAAMAFSVLAKRAEGVRIDDTRCVLKSFPDFFRELNKF